MLFKINDRVRTTSRAVGMEALIVGALLACPLAAQAQDTGNANTSIEPDDATKVSDVVVTAARTILPASALPLTVNIIDRETLTDQVAISGSVIDAVSSLSPSFSPTRQKLSGAGESLRGRSPLFAVNGIPQSTPIRDGSRDGYTIDPFFVDRVELIYGSNALQGIGATGGVVNQVTVGAPKGDGLHGRVLVQGAAADGFDNDGNGAKLAGLASYRTGAFDGTVGTAFETRGVFYDADGRRIGVDNTQGEIQNSESLSFFGRFGWQIGATTRLELLANRFELKGNGDYVVVPGNRTTGVPTSSRRGAVEGVPAANRVETVSAALTNSDLAGGDFKAQVFFHRSRDTFGGDRSPTFQDISIAPTGTLFDQSSNRSRKLGGRMSYERTVPGLDNLTATVGLDAITDKTEQLLITTNRTWVPPTEFTSTAPFVQGNLALLDDKLRLAGGLRYESVELKVDDFTTLASYGSRRVAAARRRSMRR